MASSISYTAENIGKMSLPAKNLERIRQIEGKSFPAPINCYGTVLYVNGFIDKIRAVSGYEFLETLEKNNCQKLPTSEKLQAGDVINYIFQGKGLTHSAVYFNDEWIFEKTAPEERFTPKFINIETYYAGYPASFNLQSGCKEKVGSRCVFGTIAYRCKLNPPLQASGYKSILNEPSLESCFEKPKTCSEAQISSLSSYTVQIQNKIRMKHKLATKDFELISDILIFIRRLLKFPEVTSRGQMQQFLDFLNELNDLENLTPKSFEEFEALGEENN